MTDARAGRRRSGSWLVATVVAVAAAVGLAVLYGKGSGGKDASSLCPGARDAAARLAPLARGGLAALAVDKLPAPAPDISFSGPDGKKLKLADFRGRSVLLNLWATWCVPCRAEMPALDRLQAKFGGPDFQVVAVNLDTTRLDRPKAFFAETGVKSLDLYADPSDDSFEALRLAGKALGLPTSLLIDKDGCEIGVMAGPAAWDGAEGEKAIAALIGRGEG
ncbi:MAG TPA: TlpA disulfide reductase family protein [Roseiarcus sp.]|nr:TlpA disulfide reductase family protein [Roseiarcus sp.]